MTWQQHTLALNGAQQFYQRSGNGKTLLYLHGAGGSGNAQVLMNGLAEHFDVIVPDHIGFGKSTDADWLDNIHDMAYAYLDFIKQLQLEDVILLGSSLGGWIAMEMAVRDQSRFSALILSNAAGLSHPKVPMGDVFLWDDEEKIRNMIFSTELQEKLLSMQPSEEQRALTMRNFFATAKLAWEPRFCDPHLHKWLHRITLPVQIIWGKQDQLFPEVYGQQLQQLIPHSDYVVIEKCGHLPHVEQTTAMQDAMLSFLEVNA